MSLLSYLNLFDDSNFSHCVQNICGGPSPQEFELNSPKSVLSILFYSTLFYTEKNKVFK